MREEWGRRVRSGRSCKTEREGGREMKRTCSSSSSRKSKEGFLYVYVKLIQSFQTITRNLTLTEKIEQGASAYPLIYTHNKHI